MYVTHVIVSYIFALWYPAKPSQIKQNFCAY